MAGGRTRGADGPPEPVAPLVEHFFRHEAGRLVAVLTRFFGWRNFDLVEDMVQATLVEALRAWRLRVPDNPSGWVHRAAKNKILDALRRDKIGRRAVEAWSVAHPDRIDALDHLFIESAIEDSQLRMMFACSMPVATTDTRISPSSASSKVAPTMMLASWSTSSRMRVAASSTSYSVRSRPPVGLLAILSSPSPRT